MPLATSNTLFGRDDFDDSIIVPRIVKQLTFDNGLDLHGARGFLLEKLRFKRLLTEADTREALFNRVRLSQEELACLLFDVLIQLLKKLDFKYSYTANQPVYSDGVAVDKMDLSCMGCTRSFAGLLYSFGFDPSTLFMHVSNPTNNDSVKVVMKPALNDANVKGVNGSMRDVSYVASTMAPTSDELSNGFKLQTLMSGGQAVKMVPRDPFLNHYTVHVNAGFAFPYFDPLVGARYRNGQSDAFAGYRRWNTGDLRYNGQSVTVFKNGDNDQARLYSVPDNLDFIGNTDFAQAKIKYLTEGLKLWILVDPDDWVGNVNAQFQRSRSSNTATPRTGFAPPRPQSAPPRLQIGASRVGAVTHPPNIRQLFGLV